MAGDDAIRNHRSERLEHRIDDGHRIGHPPAHRRRPHRADDAPGRHDGLEAAERAVIDRIVGRRGEALIRHLRAGIAGGDAGIVEAAHLARDLGEIDRHLVALDGDTHFDRHLLADVDAVVVHIGLRLIDPVRNRARARPRHRLGMIHDDFDGGQDLVAAIAVDQFEETPLAGFHRRDLRAQIAHGAARQPHVLLDDVDQRFVDLAAIVQFQNRDLQAFRENIRRHAAERAADIEPMRHATGKADQCALVEDRQRQGDVVEVAAGEIRIVGDVDIARPNILAAEMLDLGLHRLRHAADEHRQPDADGNRLAFGGEQAGGEIERLIDDDIVGGAHEVGLHFLGHRDDAIAHDLGDDRIGFGLARALYLLRFISIISPLDCSSRRAGSLRLCPRELDHLGPLLRLRCDEFTEFVARHRRWDTAEIDQPAFQLRVG